MKTILCFFFLLLAFGDISLAQGSLSGPNLGCVGGTSDYQFTATVGFQISSVTWKVNQTNFIPGVKNDITNGPVNVPSFTQSWTGTLPVQTGIAEVEVLCVVSYFPPGVSQLQTTTLTLAGGARVVQIPAGPSFSVSPNPVICGTSTVTFGVTQGYTNSTNVSYAVEILANLGSGTNQTFEVSTPNTTFRELSRPADNTCNPITAQARVRVVVAGVCTLRSNYTPLITRQRRVATPTAISLSPNAGTPNFPCGTTAPLTFSVPAVPFADAYDWTSSVQGITTANNQTNVFNPPTTPSTGTGGSISVIAKRSGVQSSAPSPAFAVTRVPNSVTLTQNNTGALCPSEQRTFTATLVGQGTGIYTYNWAPSAGLTEVSRPAPNQVVYRATIGVNGPWSVGVSTTGLCGTVPPPAAISGFAGAPPAVPGLLQWNSSQYNGQGCNNAYNGEFITVSAEQPNAKLFNYAWTMTVQGGNTVTESGLGRTVFSFNPQFYGSGDSNFELSLVVSNACGSRTYGCGGAVLSSGGGQQFALSVSPNPTQSELTIDASQASRRAPSSASAARAAALRYEIRAQADGSLVRSGTMAGETQRVNLDGLRTGIYAVILYSGDKVLGRRNVVKQ